MMTLTTAQQILSDLNYTFETVAPVARWGLHVSGGIKTLSSIRGWSDSQISSILQQETANLAFSGQRTTRMKIYTLSWFIYRRWVRDSEWFKGPNPGTVSVLPPSLHPPIRPVYQPPVFREYNEILFKMPYPLRFKPRGKLSDTQWNAYVERASKNYALAEVKQRQKIRRLNRKRYAAWHKGWEAHIIRKKRYDRKYQQRLTVYETRLANSRLAITKTAEKPKTIPSVHPYLKVIFKASSPVILRKTAHIWDGFVDDGFRKIPLGVLCWMQSETIFPISPKEDKDFVPHLAKNLSDVAMSAVGRIRDDHLDQLITKLYNKLNSGDLHVGNVIAERHQTVSLLKTNVQRLLKIARDGPKKFLRDVWSHHAVRPGEYSAKKLADETLAVQFGIKPLISDIQAALKLLSDLWEREDAQEFVRVAVNANGKSGVDVDLVTDAFSFRGKMHLSYVTYWNIENQFARTLEQFGLLSSDEIAWEATPWSFAFDWLVPVGAFLSAANTLTGVSYHSGTLKTRLVGHFVYGNPSNTLTEEFMYSPFVGPSVTGEFDGEIILRETPTIKPDPLRILHIKSPLSINHGIDALALAIQQAYNRQTKSLRKRGIDQRRL